MQEEIWKDIKDYEGLYQVSNLGRVRSFPRRGNYKTLHILKPGRTRKNYLKVSLTKNSINKPFSVHRLVAVERKLNFDNRNICACARHKKKSAYGFIWRYVNDTTDIIYK